MQHDARSVAFAWLAKASSDRRAIEILVSDDDPPWDIVAFHAQQLAEKSLKALLALRNFPWSKNARPVRVARQAGRHSWNSTR